MALPSSFHVIHFCGTVFYVDKETRREVEVWLASSPERTAALTIDSLLGEEVTVIADAVTGMWDCTPETRAAQREMNAIFKAEKPVSEL